MSHKLQPPRLSRAVFRWFAGNESASAMVGDLDEEFHGHVLPQLGPAKARAWYRRQALRSIPSAIGSRLARHRTRQLSERRGDALMETLLHDLKFTARSLTKNAVFSSIVVLTLALGIGANTVIYSVVEGLVLNPFPFPDADRLVAVGTQYPKLGASDLNFVEHMAPAEFMDIRDQSSTLEHVVAWDMGNRQVSMGEITENVFTGFWWGDAFDALEMPPILGRGMTLEESIRGEAVAVLSHRLWSTAFAQDPSLVGGTIMMNGDPFTVVGIMPPRAILYGMDLWIPMGVAPDVFPRNRRQFQTIARIREGHTLQEVNTELEGMARRTELAYVAEFEEYEGWRMEADTWTGANVRTLKPAAFIMMGAVGFVLLLVCSNVASLLLARSAGRRREMAVRTALGARRSRLLYQLLTESLTLAAMGGVLGVGIAWFGVQAVAGIIDGIPFLPGGVELNTRVLVFTAGVSMLAGVLFGLVPAIQGSRSALSGTLQAEGTSSTRGAGRLKLQRIFVGVEVALALVLLTGGGLVINSVIRLNAVDPGFEDEGLLTLRLTLPREEYDGPGVDAFFQTLQEGVARLPGVQAVGVGSQLPTIAFSFGRVSTEFTETLDEGQLPAAMLTLARPGYFDALGVPIQRGRTFNDLDVAGSPRVALMNEAAARMLFPGQDPIGKQVTTNGQSLEVVGIVGDTKNRGVDRQTTPELFANHRQVPQFSNQLFLLVRTTGDPLGILPAVREQVQAIDSDQPVYAIRTAEQLLEQSTGTRRIAANVLAVFAGFALILAAVGIYAVVSFTVGERTREIGLRVALGAEGSQVRRLMVRQALVPVMLGGLVGLVGAVAVGRLMEGLLFEVGASDPLTLGTVAALLMSVALLASYVPALRASRLDAVAALRDD